jgi:hypothetical protein
VIAEAEKLLLTDDLTKCVEWILRDYFRNKGDNHTLVATAPQQSANKQASIIDDLDDVFAA